MPRQIGPVVQYACLYFQYACLYYRHESDEREQTLARSVDRRRPITGGGKMRGYLAALMIIVVSTLALQGRSARAAEPTAAGLWEQVSKSTGKPDAWFLVSEHDGLYEA